MITKLNSVKVLFPSPAILFVKDGKVVDKLVGAQPKVNFVKKIEALK